MKHANPPGSLLTPHEQAVAAQVEQFEAAQQAAKDADEAERAELIARIEARRNDMRAWVPGQRDDLWRPNVAPAAQPRSEDDKTNPE